MRSATEAMTRDGRYGNRSASARVLIPVSTRIVSRPASRPHSTSVSIRSPIIAVVSECAPIVFGSQAPDSGNSEILARFGDSCGSTKGVAVRLRTGETDLADVVRALDSAEIKVENLQLHQPSLDDVFLAKTGRSLEGSDEEEAEPAGRELAAEPA